MSNFLIFKAAFNNSATPAIGTYTAEGATAYFNRNLSISPDYYLYGNTAGSAVRWFVPTAETTDFEFVADILTTEFGDRVTYFSIADGTGTTRLRMWSLNNFVYLANDDSNAQSGTQFIGRLAKTDIGGFEIFHQFRVRVRKLTESSSSVEVYVDGTLKLTATAGACRVTCAKIGFMGGVNDSVTLRDRIGIQNTYVYDLSGGDVIDRGVLSGAFNRFISWAKGIFALKSDIPTVNNGTLTIQQNGTNVQTFTANASTNATANIQCVDLSTAQTIAGDKNFTGTTGTHDVIPEATDTYDLGSSTKEYNNAYVKALTVNGTAAGDILTHNAAEFVPVSGGAVMTGSLGPSTSGGASLGDSSHKWSTINGVDPGALSLPDQTAGVDISSLLTTTGTGTYTWTATADGWVTWGFGAGSSTGSIQNITHAAGVPMGNDFQLKLNAGSGIWSDAVIFLPIKKGAKLQFTFGGAGWYRAYFFPCAGNV